MIIDVRGRITSIRKDKNDPYAVFINIKEYPWGGIKKVRLGSYTEYNLIHSLLEKGKYIFVKCQDSYHHKYYTVSSIRCISDIKNVICRY